jgi:hypothetical protein
MCLANRRVWAQAHHEPGSEQMKWPRPRITDQRHPKGNHEAHAQVVNGMRRSARDRGSAEPAFEKAVRGIDLRIGLGVTWNKEDPITSRDGGR